MLHSLFSTDFLIRVHNMIKQQVDISSMQWKNLNFHKLKIIDNFKEKTLLRSNYCRKYKIYKCL
jgi:hypothetical protein